MQIRDHTEHGKLNEGDLVRAANGELRLVSKHQSRTPPGPVETWLLHWSDEYAVWLTDEKFVGLDGQRAEDVFPLTVVTTVPVVALSSAGQRSAPSPVFAKGDRVGSFRDVVVEYSIQKQMDVLRPYAEAEPAQYEPLSRFEPAARQGAERFATALLDRRPELAEAREGMARTLVDLLYLVSAHVGDPNDWDHVGTVLDLVDWVADRLEAEADRRAAALASDLRHSATIMEPRAATAYRHLAEQLDAGGTTVAEATAGPGGEVP